MDHTSAQMIEFNGIGEDPNVIESAFNSEPGDSLGKSDHAKQNKNELRQSAYYKKLGDVILEYNEVVLFGPAKGKSELLKILKRNERFADIKIVVKAADTMSENEQLTFVYDYFSPN